MAIFLDGQFRLRNSLYPDKEVQFDVSAISRNTIRLVAWPDKDGTVAFLSDIGGSFVATDYLYLPGRVGGQTLTWVDATTPAMTVSNGALSTNAVIWKVSGTSGYGLFVYNAPNPGNATTGHSVLVEGDLRVHANSGALMVAANSATIDFKSSSVFNFNNRVAADSLSVSSISTPGSPATHQIWRDSTQKAFLGFPNSVNQSFDGTVFIMTSSQTRTGASPNVENDLLTTGLGTLALPADFFVAGKTVCLIVDGYYGCVAGATMRLRVKLTDSSAVVTTIADTTGTLATAATNKAFSMAITITCRSVAANVATCFCQMLTYYETNAAAAQTPNTATFTCASNKTETVSVTELWGVSTSATNTITASNAVLKVLY